ncbi:MAG: ATP-dependent metallopeptidase FtsH/Yme1/Tma family protein, partial [Anaerolineales bacterium]|nr:ATP-dependent metallopeptidase FtsH/Yme1/Tma family protein [Anaerolineales bacterium]
MKPAWIRNIFVYILIIVALGALFFQFLSSSNEAKETDIATVAQEIRDGNVSAIKVEGNALTVTLRDQEEPLQSRKEPQVGVVEYLRGLGLTPEQLQDVQISYERPSSFSNLTPILIYLVPLLLFGGFLIFMLRQAQG